VNHLTPHAAPLAGTAMSDERLVPTFDMPAPYLPKQSPISDNRRKEALRKAAALENLLRLCERLGILEDDTPREFLNRHGYDPGNG
jgi:hypothetical protein